MTFIWVPKDWLLGAFLLLIVASLSLVACRPEASSADEASLVWEAWALINNSYVEADTLDSEQVAGAMITKMLEVSEKPPYPFLTELAEVRAKPPRGVPKELADVWRAWVHFMEKWPEESPQMLADAAVDGMLASLGDPSASHLTSEAYHRQQERLQGSYEGIGAFVTIEDGKIVLSPMDDSPALRAGLEVGDVVLEVNGVSVEGRSLQEVVDEVRGPVGTKVALRIERPGEDEPLEKNVIRGDIDMVSVDRRLLPGAIGYIYISEFQANTPDEVVDILEELRLVDMLALILDLRSNPGGSIESAQKVASQFLSEGLFMYEIDRDENRKDWHIEEGGAADIGELPILVLVNEATTSAAEAVAGALQDAERAKIVGTRTFGKGSASQFFKLSDGSAIYVPVSHWYTPLGNLIQGTGIVPDVEVEITAEDRLVGLDSQLLEAYEYLNDLLPHFR